MLQVAVLLDQTGSMQPKKRETILSFNSYMSDLFTNKIDCEFTLTLFNSDRVEVRYLKAKLADGAIEPLDEQNYWPMSNTPLLDAIGKGIKAVGDEKDCLFVIFTDGEENSSREYSKIEIRRMIEEREGVGWKFLFFGIGGMDAVTEAGSLGIRRVDTIGTQTADLVSTSTRTASVLTSGYAMASSAGVSYNVNAQQVYDQIKKSDQDAQDSEADRLTKKLKGKPV